MEKIKVQKIIICILLITIGVLYAQIRYYEENPRYETRTIEDFDFKDLIRSIDYQMNTEDIYRIEGRKEDEILDSKGIYPDNWISYLYKNAQFENYTGTLTYTFVDDKVSIIIFYFNDKLEYAKYKNEFKNEFSEGSKKLTDGRVQWTGHVGEVNTIVEFSDSSLSISKSKVMRYFIDEEHLL